MDSTLYPRYTPHLSEAILCAEEGIDPPKRIKIYGHFPDPRYEAIRHHELAHPILKHDYAD